MTDNEPHLVIYRFSRWLKMAVGRKLKFESDFFKIKGVISRTTAPILGLFVLNCLIVNVSFIIFFNYGNDDF